MIVLELLYSIDFTYYLKKELDVNELNQHHSKYLIIREDIPQVFYLHLNYLQGFLDHLLELPSYQACLDHSYFYIHLQVKYRL